MRDEEAPSPIPAWAAVVLPVGAYVRIRAVVHGGAAIRAVARSQPLGDALHDVLLDPFNLAFFQLVGFGAVIIGGLFAFAGERSTRQALAIRPVNVQIIVFAVIGGAALQFPLAEVGNLMAEIFPRSLEQQLTQRRIITPTGPLSALAIVFAVAVVAPLTEELLFRGLLLPGLAERYGAPFALGVTSLGFGLIHGEPGAIVYSSVAGVVLGAITLRTGSVLPALAMHGAINAMPILVPERLLRIPGFNTISEDVQHLPVTLLVGSGVVAATAILALAHFNDVMADGPR